MLKFFKFFVFLSFPSLVYSAAPSDLLKDAIENKLHDGYSSITAQADAAFSQGLNIHLPPANIDESFIHLAARHNNLVMLDWLIKHGISVNSQVARDGRTPLICAAIRGNNDSLLFLLKNKAKINLQSKLGHTALHAAIMCKHPEAVGILLSHGADVTIKNQLDESPLSLSRKTLNNNPVTNNCAQDQIAKLLNIHVSHPNYFNTHVSVSMHKSQSPHAKYSRCPARRIVANSNTKKNQQNTS